MKIRLPKLLGLVTTFVMLISTLVAIPVSAMSGVSVAVTSATNKIDDVGNYNIYATLGTQLTGSTADTITLTLPSGFTIGTAPTLTLIASSGWVTIPPAIVPSFQTAVTTAYASTGSGQTIVITLGAGDYIGAGAQILLNITAGITNPSVAGDYRLTFKTSKETTAITSNAFTIYNSSTTTTNTITATTTGVSVAVTSATNKIDDVGNYNIYATLGTQLTGSTADTIILTLPTGFTIGAAPTLTLAASSGWVTIPPAIVPSFQTAVTTAYTSTSSGQTIVITLGAGDYIGAQAQIWLDITAGITNPSVAGDYRLNFKTSKENTAITSNAFTIYNPSTTTARTTTTIQSGGAIVVQPATGVSARISGSSAADGTSITVSSIDYGNNQPSGTGTIQLNDTEYYDVNVSSSISLGAGAMAEITIASSSVTVNSTMGYWYGGVWNVASNIAINMLVSPPTITGDIPVSALGGTPIVIGMASLPPAPPAPTPEMPAVALLSIGLVGLVGYAFIRREKTISKNIEE